LSTIAVGFGVLCATFLAWSGARILVPLGRYWTELLDTPFSHLRKLHSDPTPRVGGTAIAAGMAGGLATAWVLGEEVAPAYLLLVCLSPAFAWGLIEDLAKRGEVLKRLVFSALAGAAGFAFLDVRITHVDVPVLDSLLTIDVVSFAFTLVALAGAAHAVNIIDGLNGLAGVTTLLASMALAVVAWSVGDAFVFQTASILAASIAGFLAVNFPSGRIFLGDGGAYLVGLALAMLSVLLVHRNAEVSAWFPLVLLSYPVWETLFSMYRRKLRGHPAGRADALHLHTLVYRRVVRWKGPGASPEDHVVRNSLATVRLLSIPMATTAVALACWDHSLVLQGAALGLAVIYVAVYRRIVLFKVPAWLVVRWDETPMGAAAAKPR
jgi:UDP-N-acetylmuramyl pentapeptide phosphotransferase/UDP-N-acetylglucosamine-1-phosphate transferase